MVIEDEIVRFKMQLLRKMPFYGDIVMRLPIVRNDAVATAQTNGRLIEYNAKFLSGTEKFCYNARDIPCAPISLR